MKRPSCSAALSESLKPETCHNFRGVRQWVMCRAWEKEQEGMPFNEAISSAWDEAISECATFGASPLGGEKPLSVKVSELLDRETGHKSGKIVLTDDDLTVCVGGDCSTTSGGKRLYHIARAFFDAIGYDVIETQGVIR